MLSHGCAGGAESMQRLHHGAWSNNDRNETNVCKNSACITTVQSSMGEIGLQRYILGEPSQVWELGELVLRK